MLSFVVPGTASWRQCCGACWAFILLLATAILIGASFHTLSPTEMGLDYDMWTCQVNDKVLFGNGRWFLGPGHSFIIFPKATRSVLMLSRAADSSTISDQQFSSLVARTYDGLSVELELSYQYRLEAAAESLASLYRDFGLDYEVGLGLGRARQGWG